MKESTLMKTHSIVPILTGNSHLKCVQKNMIEDSTLLKNIRLQTVSFNILVSLGVSSVVPEATYEARFRALEGLDSVLGP